MEPLPTHQQRDKSTMEGPNHPVHQSSHRENGVYEKRHCHARIIAVCFLAFLVLSVQSDRRSLSSFKASTTLTFTEEPQPTMTPPLICSPWEDDMDPWWNSHPDYEPYGENETHTCFRPLLNPARQQFYQQVYINQYHGKDCSHIRTRKLVNIGYAASVSWWAYGMWRAKEWGVPFEMVKHKATIRWMYSPPYQGIPIENRSWAACPEEDHHCYFLPISNCQPPMSDASMDVRPTFLLRALAQNPSMMEQFLWIKWYLTRPKQMVRQRLLELMKKEAPMMNMGDCTWIHVRRGDATTERFARNFYPLHEYLERGNVSTSDNILLLTDDETAIDEATLLYPQYKWHYWKRTRNRGEVAKNSHIPSNDHAREMLVLLGEIELAGKCKKGVHGTSNMVELFKMAMVNNHGINNIQLIQIDEELKQQKENATAFVLELEKKLEEARKKQSLWL